MSLDIYLTCEPCQKCGRGSETWSANITHNLNRMADEADIYGIVWRPEENGIETAAQMVDPLRAAIESMEAGPERFRAFDSPNGWGTYRDFLPWLRELLEACEERPTWRVSVSR